MCADRENYQTLPFEKRLLQATSIGTHVADGLDEGFFQVIATGTVSDSFSAVLQHNLPLGDNHDLVTKRSDLLHDVAGKQYALAGCLKGLDKFAQRAYGHHVQTVAGLIKNNILRPVYERPRQRDLGALSL